MKNLENFGNIDLYGVRVAAPPETGEIIKNLETCKILKIFINYVIILCQWKPAKWFLHVQISRMSVLEGLLR